MKLNKKDKKEVIFSMLKANLKDKEYKYNLIGGAPTFYKLLDNGSIGNFFLNFNDSGTINCSTMNISHIQVEDIIIEIGLPNFDFDNAFIKRYKANKSFMDTVRDLQNKTIPHSFNPEEFETHIQIKDFGKQIIEYLDNSGFGFLQKYSYLPNILVEMDKLEAEGRDWNEILNGMGDRLFRGLIISHLCNDPNYKKKEEFCDYKFNNVALLEEWQPYYARLKERLKTVEPIYNI